MTTGGGGFQYGDDNESVVARVDINVPTEGIQNLRDITTETHKFQVEMESASRMTQDFVGYLKQLPDIQKQVVETQKALVQQLERTVEVQKQLTSGSSGVPAGPAQSPWQGITSGMGARPLNESDYAKQLGLTDVRALQVAYEGRGQRQGDMPAATPQDQLTTIGDRQAARDAATQNQQVATPSAKHIPKDSAAAAGSPFDKAKMAANLATPIMNEMGAGGSTEGMLGALGQSAGGLGMLLKGLGGGALGGLGGTIAGVGGPLAAAGAGLLAFEKGGNVVEGWRQMGQTRGGGWQEGLGYEMNVRAMAMNPFINTDQARKIVQGALSEGYTGKEYDTVLDFVSGNLKAMNMDISQQFQVLRKSVMEGGATVTGTNMNLATISELSKSGYLTNPERQEDFTRLTTAYTNMGISGPQGQLFAMNAQQAWSGDQTLKGTGVSLAEGMQDPKAAIMAAHMLGINIPPGTLPEAIPLKLAEMGIDPAQAGEGLLKKFAQRALSQTRDIDNATVLFQKYVKAYMPGLQNQEGDKIASDITYAKKMLLSLTGQQDPWQQGVNEVQEQTQANTSQIENRSGAEQVGANIVGFGAALFGGIADFVTGNGENIDTRMQNQKYGTASSHIPAMDQVVRQYGVKGLEVQDGSGEWVPFKPNDRGQLEGLSSGKYKYRPTGTDSEGTTLANTTQQVTNNYNTNQYNPGNANAQVQGTLNINVNPSQFQSALGVPQQVKLSPNQVQANQGYSTATMNAPPPGYNPSGR